ncbi:MAG: recombinase family protein [Myxococcota bacterium]
MSRETGQHHTPVDGGEQPSDAIIRVSTRKQLDNNSPPIQREDIEEYAARKWLETRPHRGDSRISEDLEAPDKVQESLDEARAGGIRHIICWRFDRHTRNFTDLESMRDDITEGVFAAFHIAMDNKVFFSGTPRC